MSFNPKSIFKTKSTRRLVFVVLIAITLATGVFVYFETHHNSHKKIILYPAGTGGSTQQLISYHDQAVQAWKKGDNKNAKELAVKGLTENDKLTTAQKGQIPNQIKIVTDLYLLSKGAYDGE